MQTAISFFDIILCILIVAGASIMAHNVYTKNIETRWNYSLYKKALFARIAFACIFLMVYLLFYGGGDTLYYFSGSRSIVKLAYKDFGATFRMLLGERTPELGSLFDSSTGRSPYFRDANAWAVCRLMVPFYLLGFGSLWGTSLVLCIVMFFVMWDFYKMLCKMYPKESKYMAIPLFFLPSAVFWSSGILKDVWCLVAVLQLYKAIWLIFFRKHRIIGNIFRFVVCVYILISIRPFIFYIAFASSLLWLVFWQIKTIQNRLIKIVAFPFILSVSFMIVVITLQSFGEAIGGRYGDFDSILQHAVVVQTDLTQDYYGGNSFDIGRFDASISSILTKAPIAIISGLFRPFLWEGSSMLLKVSALESTLILLFCMYLCLKTRIVGLLKIIINDSFLSSICVFVIITAFFTGLTIANFGALVRYRIVYLPLFCIILLRAWSLSKGNNVRKQM